MNTLAFRLVWITLFIFLTSCGSDKEQDVAEAICLSGETPFTISASHNTGGTVSPSSAIGCPGESIGWDIQIDPGFKIDLEGTYGCPINLQQSNLSGSYTSGALNEACHLTVTFIERINRTIDYKINFPRTEMDELDPAVFDAYEYEDIPESAYHHKISLNHRANNKYPGSEDLLEVFFILEDAENRIWQLRFFNNGKFINPHPDYGLGQLAVIDFKLIFNADGTQGYSTWDGIFRLDLNPDGNEDVAYDDVFLDFSESVESNEAFKNHSIWLYHTGNGFFVVKPVNNLNKYLYTRAGDFFVNDEGILVNRYGEQLLAFPVNNDGSIAGSSLNSTSPIQLSSPENSFDILTNGLIQEYLSDDTTRYIGKIALAEFTNPQDLIKVEGTISLEPFYPSDFALAVEATFGNAGLIIPDTLLPDNVPMSPYPISLTIDGVGYFIHTSDLISSGYVISKSSTFRTDIHGYVVNENWQYLQTVYIEQDLVPTEINHLNETMPLLLPSFAGPPNPTDTVYLSVELRRTSPGTNLSLFDHTDPQTYESSTSFSILDYFGEEHELAFYFVHDISDLNQWAVYMFLDGRAVDVTDGVSGSNNQRYVELQFDSAGELISIDPASIIVPTNYINGARNEEIKIDFSDITATNGPFAITGFTHNGYTVSRFEKFTVNNEVYTGIIRSHWTDGRRTLTSRIPLVRVENPSCLLKVGDTESFLLGSNCSYTLGFPEQNGLGSVTGNYEKWYSSE